VPGAELKKTIKNSKNLFLWVAGVTVMLMVSCSPTRYVPEGEYLLTNNKVILHKEGPGEVSRDELKGYITQQPNRRFLGMRFGLFLYNMSGPDEEKKFNKWLRKTGEPPVILDTAEVKNSSRQMRNFVGSRGYFRAVVEDSIEYRERSRARVYYEIWTGQPYKIRHITYVVKDSLVRDLVLSDTLHAAIRPGKVFNVDNLEEERSHLETLFRDSGYYAFIKDYVSFLVDTTVGNHLLDITVVVSKALKQTPNLEVVEVPHLRYKIRNVYFFTDYDPQKAIEKRSEYFSALDTAYVKGYYFISKEDSNYLKKKVILQSNYIYPGKIYNLEDVELTRKHLSGLNVYKFVNVYFTEIPSEGEDTTGIRPLDCHIQLSPVKQQSYTVELEGTNSSGNMGVAVSFNYLHRNLFHGAENFNIGIKQSLEALAQEKKGLKRIVGTDLNANLVFGKFLGPFFNKDRFVKKYAPKTTIGMTFNYQRRPDYTRTIFTTHLGYSWQSSKNVSQVLSPLSLNSVKLPYIDSAFLEQLDTTTYMAYSYKDVFISAASYSYIFNTGMLNRMSNHVFVRINAEAAGNLLYVGYKIAGARTDTTGSYSIFGLNYAQYFKTDIDVRYTNVLSKVSSMTYRFFAGVAIPYLNSRAVPFEKQYYAGGANGIRAWQVRSLGPGSYTEENSNFYNQTADMKLEWNLEYRFKMFWILEGALFTDMGNIWAISKQDDRPGALFKFSNFFNDIAVGAGLGLRFDFSFFIFRVDMGVKMRDPGAPQGYNWIPFDRHFSWRKDVTLQIGIGYPF
jgi:outer membrane protein assembly factor BamA